ncbi:MAG: arsenate reductase ArsC [Nitrospiraceae bacterium]|nr:arsenate reductase ArsC [Nitrospiraceae bacterium]OQW63861.1 MAG: phosphotyrosine protein phosphatase [Nitrospira sp. ST-bin5]
MAVDSKKVLILCTGNSCRSIMAEALLNELGQGRFQAWSAGSFPTEYVYPRSIETLKRHGIDPGQPHSKSWNEFAAQPLDLIITVCDQAAGETCPIFPGKPMKLHWGTPDPAKMVGNEADTQAAFDRAFFFLKERVEQLIAASECSQ